MPTELDDGSRTAEELNVVVGTSSSSEVAIKGAFATRLSGYDRGTDNTYDFINYNSDGGVA